MPPLRPCAYAGCSALVHKGRCPAHASSSPSSPSSHSSTRSLHHLFKPFYNSPHWKRTRLLYLSSHPLCELGYCTPRAPATEVHHITSLHLLLQGFGLPPSLALGSWPVEVWRRALDPVGLQALCKSCHSRVTVERDGGFVG